MTKLTLQHFAKPIHGFCWATVQLGRLVLQNLTELTLFQMGQSFFV
jgi:hypothetical protein